MGNGYIRAAVLSVALAAASTSCSSKKDSAAPEKPDPSKYGRITLDCSDIKVQTDINGIKHTSLPDGVKSAFYSETDVRDEWTTDTNKGVFRYEQPNAPQRFVQLVVTTDLVRRDGKIDDATETSLEVVTTEIGQEIFDEPLNRAVARDASEYVIDSGFDASDYHEPLTFIDIVEHGDDNWQRRNLLESGETVEFPITIVNYTPGVEQLIVPCKVEADFRER